MSKELIRNGGFQRGNTDFWEGLEVASIEAIAAAAKHGNYGCKVISSGAGFGYLKGLDYIPVDAFGSYLLSVWIKNSKVKNMVIYAWEYDSDRQAIGGSGFPARSLGTDYTQIEEIYQTRKGVSYIRLRIGQLLMDAGDYSYIDSISCKEIDLARISSGHESLVEVEDLAADDTFYGEEIFTGVWESGEFVLKVTSLTGTAPKLDVTIEAYDPATETWTTAITFTQATGVTTEKKQSLNAAYVGIGWKNRVKYVTSGTITDCDFEVGAVYKR